MSYPFQVEPRWRKYWQEMILQGGVCLFLIFQPLLSVAQAIAPPDAIQTDRKNEVVLAWLNTITTLLDRYDNPILAWIELEEALRYMVGMIEDRPRAIPIHLSHPGDSDYRAIGSGLREYWEKRRWHWTPYDFNQYLVLMIIEYAPDLDRYLVAVRRFLEMAGPDPRDLRQIYWTWGVFITLHLRATGMHVEQVERGPMDNQLLVEAVRRFIPLLVTLPEEKNPRERRYRLLWYWGLKVMLDPRIHNPYVRSSYIRPSQTDQYAQTVWPGSSRVENAISHHLFLMLSDLRYLDSNGEPTGEVIDPAKVKILLAEVLSKSDEEWRQLGFRSPWEIAYGSMERWLVEEPFVEYQAKRFHRWTYNIAIPGKSPKDSQMARYQPYYLWLFAPTMPLAKRYQEWDSAGKFFEEAIIAYRRGVIPFKKVESAGKRLKRLTPSADVFIPDANAFQEEVFFNWGPLKQLFPDLKEMVAAIRAKGKTPDREAVAIAIAL